ncbi:MAG: 2-dehydropantoate 2-reductase, partial [Armatimonadetes bacterium]|nr:2-dehydropantoate 2-reductase [Armatimonadota bacterium]
MKIAVIGAGGTGGYYGAQLQRSGQEVAFIARGGHLAAMRER